ncbi:MAG: hypothetical protein ACREBS_00350 [Nitrososphaerales archaeon]
MTDEGIIIGILAISLLSIIIVIWRVSKLQTEIKNAQRDLADKVAPIQGITGLANGLASSVSNLQLEIGNIRQQAERIAVLEGVLEVHDHGI